MKPLVSMASMLLLASSQAAFGTVSVFPSETAFTAAAPGLAMESFETPFISALSQAFTGFSVTKSGGNGLQSFAMDPTDGSLSMNTALNNGETITFTFDNPINAFGFNMRDFGTVGFTSSLSLATNAPSDLGALITATSHLPFDNTLEFGMIDSAAMFTTVTLSYVGGGGDGVFFDEVRFGIAPLNDGNGVPLPSAIWTGLALSGTILGWRALRNGR